MTFQPFNILKADLMYNSQKLTHLFLGEHGGPVVGRQTQSRGQMGSYIAAAVL